MAAVGDGLDVRSKTRSLHDPFRYWLTGILVELAAFTAFTLVLVGTTAVLVLVFGG